MAHRLMSENNRLIRGLQQNGSGEMVTINHYLINFVNWFCRIRNLCNDDSDGNDNAAKQ